MNAMIEFSVVVFPAAFGPMRPNTSPASTSEETPPTAVTSPERFSRPLTEIIP